MESQKIVCFGEILWDNLKEGRRLGGAPLNVCYHLNKLGINSSIVTQIGSDPDGIEILKELKRLGVSDEFCTTSAYKPTSTVNVKVTEPEQISYEIVEDVAWDYIKCTDDIKKLVTNASGLVFGSLIARNEISRHTLFGLIKKSKYRIFDVNLRYPFYSKDLIYSLLEETDLLKLNEDEITIISKWLGSGRGEEINQKITYLQACFPNIKEIILTRGSMGAIYFSDTESIKVDAYPVEVQDTVGSGDAFLAGFVANKINKKPIRTALQQASILSSYIAGQRGGCPEYDLQDLIGLGD